MAKIVCTVEDNVILFSLYVCNRACHVDPRDNVFVCFAVYLFCFGVGDRQLIITCTVRVLHHTYELLTSVVIANIITTAAMPLPPT